MPDARTLAVAGRPLRVAHRVQLGLEFLPLVAEQFSTLRFREFFLLQSGGEVLVLPVHIGGDLLANQFKEADQEAAGAAGWVANDVSLLRLHHADHKLDDGARREELADLAPERPAEEPLKRNALHVLAGIGKVVGFEALDDFFDGGWAEVDALAIVENLVCLVRFPRLLKKGVDRVFGQLLFEDRDREQVSPLALLTHSAL